MSYSILVVEDNDNLRMIMSMQLKRLGFVCQSAQDGLEAFEMTCLTNFDLILMDIQMPRMDGVEACLAMRDYEQVNHSPRKIILAVTANPDKERFLEAGMDGFLFKPVLLAELKAAVDYHQAV